MKNKKTLLLIIGFVVIIAGAAAAYNYFGDRVEADNLAQSEKNESSQTTAEDTGKEELSLAPDFTVTNSVGESIRLSDFRGKPTIVNFWASWCGPCKMEMPDFQQAYEIYGDEVNFLMINMTDKSRETVNIARDFISESGYSFPVYYDTFMEAAMVYGVNTIPQTYFVTADGRIGAYAQSMLDMATIEKGINMIK